MTMTTTKSFMEDFLEVRIHGSYCGRFLTSRTTKASNINVAK